MDDSSTMDEETLFTVKIQRMEDALRFLLELTNYTFTVFEDLCSYLGTVSPSKLDVLREENHGLETAIPVLLRQMKREDWDSESI